MMTRLQYSLLLCFAFAFATVHCSTRLSSAQHSASVETSQAGVRGAVPLQQKRSSSLRRLMKNDKGGGMNNMGGGGGGINNGIARENENANGLIEPPPGICQDFNSQGVQDRAASSLSDSECVTNSCNGGCCRIYNWLICDESNSFDHLQCVCNGNTSPTPPPVPRPTMPPPTTAAPTPPPPTTAAPTTARPTNPPPSTSAPVVSPTLPFNTTDANVTIVDREDNFPLGIIPLPSPAPMTAAPVTPMTAAPVTPAPTTAAPVTPPPSPAPQTPVPGPVQPWEQCAGGSVYHGNFDANTCFFAEDCAEKNECCIRNFCLCGDPGALTSECVPSRFT